MHSKNTINGTRKVNVGIGLQHIYLLDVQGLSSKSFYATPSHFIKPKFSFKKASRGKFLDVMLARFAVRIAALMENICSKAAELGLGVLYFMNISTRNLSIH